MTSVILVTSTSMNASQIVSTTVETTTTSANDINSLTSTSTTSPLSVSQDDIPLLHDSILISSVLGGFSILLISTLAVIYFFYKRRKRQRQLNYSPPFTSLAPPLRSALSPPTLRSSPIPPEEPQETSLSMGPGIHTAAEPPRLHSSVSASQQQRRSEGGSASPGKNLPSIFLESSSPPTIDNPQNISNHPHPQSTLYHDLLREETASIASRRHGRHDTPGPSALRPVSGVSDMSDIDTRQLRRFIGEGEGGRGFPSTRASSGVFPDD